MWMKRFPNCRDGSFVKKVADRCAGRRAAIEGSMKKWFDRDQVPRGRVPLHEP